MNFCEFLHMYGNGFETDGNRFSTDGKRCEIFAKLLQLIIGKGLQEVVA